MTRNEQIENVENCIAKNDIKGALRGLVELQKPAPKKAKK